MSAVQIPEKFTVCLLRHIGTNCACTHACIPYPCIHDASGQRDAAIAGDRFTSFPA